MTTSAVLAPHPPAASARSESPMVPGQVIALSPGASNAPGCRRCETLPEKLAGPGRLHLRFPLTHSLGKITEFLRASSWQWEHKENGLLWVELPAELEPFADAVEKALSPLEMNDVKVFFERAGRVAELGDYLLDVISLTQFVARCRLDWLSDLLREERLTSYFHPILDASSGEVYAQEALMRGLTQTEQIIGAGPILSTARGAGLLFQLDLAARRSAIGNAAKHGIDSKLFINFMPTAIYDPVFCLRSTVNFVRERGLSPEQIVFEVVESEEVEDRAHLIKILDYYREHGFKVALDDVGAGYSGLTLLAELRPDYIKLDRALISRMDEDYYRAIIASKLIETAHELGVLVVAEGIEREEEWRWLQNNGADFVQGFLFARPSAVPFVN